ncbi:MAG: hypothetical protein ACAH88_16300, partial [Roseimicrobium sp.]
MTPSTLLSVCASGLSLESYAEGPGLRAACCRFPSAQPAARITATKSPSILDTSPYERVSPSPQ